MKRAIVLIAVFLSITLHAQPVLERGDVLAQSHIFDVLIQIPPPGDTVTIAGPTGAIKSYDAPLKMPAVFGRNGLLFLNPALAIQWWDQGIQEWRPGIGVSATPLRLAFPQTFFRLEESELLRTRSGDFLVAEYSRLGAKPRLLRFTLAGDIVRIFEMPDAPLVQTIPLEYDGIAHIELLADQCTLLWSPRQLERHQVRTFDICTGLAKAPFLSTTSSADPREDRVTGIRALPNGDVLIATPVDVRRYDRGGGKLDSYPVPETWFGEQLAHDTLLALTPDASGYWAGRNDLVQRFDFASPSVPAATFNACHCGDLFALSVVDEWRAALQPLPIPKRRSVR